MENFKKLEITDFEIINPLLKKYNVENCDHCFFTMLIWSFRHHVEYTICENTLFMRTLGDNSYWYLSPVGELPFEKAVQLIIDDAKLNSYRIKIYAMDENQKIAMDQHFGSLFEIIADRDTFDYIYKTEDLSNLSGKNYQKKRNHCSRFERDNPDYRFYSITAENVERVKAFEREWCARNNCDESRGLFSEQQGIMEILSNMEKTDVFGGFIEANNGNIVAFTLASPINDNMVDIIVEKAFHEVTGAYAIINRDFARNCLQNFEFINREDDMGQENLRKAKLANFPVEIRTKYMAKLDVV
ncbi:MAG: DUF2156 domain-containing protein [Oscillospiraceae bacterium]|nr:DUF2156 domain-containing protein [Oscillospiraceae bacterium]